MELITLLFITGTAALAGIIVGYFLRWLVTVGRKGSAELTAKKLLLEAKEEAQQIIDKAAEQLDSVEQEIKAAERAKETEFKHKEERLLKKEDLLDRRQADLDRLAEELKGEAAKQKQQAAELEKLERRRLDELERIAGLSMEAARDEIIKLAEKNYQEDMVVRIKKLEAEAGDELTRRARDILTTAIQRLANSTVPEILATTVEIPSDDMKGKIIGKEGRNIRAFEKATGVEVIIDDTPGQVALSSFDPVRREIARLALTKLISDGRIQPAKIEEAVERAKSEVADIIKAHGEEAAYQAGVLNLDPRILLILGRLHFRTSYGQNVLGHSVEMAHLAGMLAEELGADAAVARAGALLHDIGKAVDHEVPGTHVEIGKRILEKFGADPKVIQAMQSHHDEYPYETLESKIVQAADAISGSRPGARRDTLENYLKRLKEIEDLASAFPGIEKVYAIQAGREIRVFVKPEEISDLAMRGLARDIAVKIEQELKYPGEIKVVVSRETQAIEYAR